MPEGLGTNVSIKPIVAVPASIGASATYDTGVFKLGGPGISFGYLAAGATTYSFQRYLDSKKLLPIGSALTGAGTAATAVTNHVNDGVPALYGDLTITDTSAAPNAVTAFSIIISSTGS